MTIVSFSSFLVIPHCQMKIKINKKTARDSLKIFYDTSRLYKHAWSWFIKILSYLLRRKRHFLRLYFISLQASPRLLRNPLPFSRLFHTCFRIPWNSLILIQTRKKFFKSRSRLFVRFLKTRFDFFLKICYSHLRLPILFLSEKGGG